MRPFRRSPSAAPMPAPPPPAPVAQPAMPNPYLRNLPQPTQVAQPVGLDQQRVQQSQPMGLQQRLMQQAQPNLSGAIGQLRAGDSVAAQNTMRQIVGLPPLPAAPQMANPSLADAIALGKTGDQAGMQRMMQQIVGLPPSGAPQQPMGLQQRLMQEAQLKQNALQAAQANREMGPVGPQPNIFGQPGQMTDFQRTAMEMQQRQAQIASQMGQQPGMTPAQAALGKQGFLPGQMPQGEQRASPFDDAARQQISQLLRDQMQTGQTGPLGGMPPGQQFADPMMNAQQPYMPQRMTMDMPQAQQPMPEFPTQPGLTPMPFPQPGMQPQQPNSLGQQFGQAQNPFARPMPQGIGQSLQQPMNNAMTNSALGGGGQPQRSGLQQQPQGQSNMPSAMSGQPSTGSSMAIDTRPRSGSTGRAGLF